MHYLCSLKVSNKSFKFKKQTEKNKQSYEFFMDEETIWEKSRSSSGNGGRKRQSKAPTLFFYLGGQ